jgi:hypothetical protein
MKEGEREREEGKKQMKWKRKRGEREKGVQKRREEGRMK